ncbi:MAG: hypothetical protein R3F14_46215 [Polyangiaceae bacterium]
MNNLPHPVGPRRAVASLAVCAAACALMASCQQRPICPVSPILTSQVYERLATSHVDKVDILLAIDNSRSMADKQALLALAVPDLVEGLVNPPCEDANGAPVTPLPEGPLAPCPKGSRRPFDPVLDIHVGVITTSLGGFGSDVCKGTSPGKESENDKAHLVFRSDAASPNDLPTYEGKGFLAWDPDQKLAPNGEADLEVDTGADANDTALLPSLRDMITGVGDQGCGFESQLESWYRFLADPEPPVSYEVSSGGKAVPTGLDKELLAQRAAFLRHDSLLAIVLLTDEDDCSVKDDGFSYVSFRQKTESGGQYLLPRARAVCETNPQDPCCYSCGTGPKQGADGNECPADPTCTGPDGKLAYLTPDEDRINLRCWDQKRRFGIDFLQPIERYKRALTEPTIVNRDGAEVPNPLFTKADAALPGNIRTSNMVVLTAIAGVPWQDIAVDPTDLTKGIKTAEELDVAGPGGLTPWDMILGDPDKGVPPADPLMIPSVKQRTGVHPVTGEPVATEDTPLQNSINGHDYPVGDDLQYACIFDLPEAIPCDPAAGTCSDPDASPVYNPPYDAAPTEQVRAGARPGKRILSLLRDTGSQGVVGSACPAQVKDGDAADFGYRPAITAALTRLRSLISAQCMPRALTPDPDGQVPCAVLEARHTDADGGCCDADKARLDPREEHAGLIDVLRDDPLVTERGLDCFCEIPQLEGAELSACQTDTAESPLSGGEPVNGYCYVDAMSTPPVGDPAIVDQCPATERRLLRFVGEGQPNPGSVVFLTCGTQSEPVEESCDP